MGKGSQPQGRAKGGRASSSKASAATPSAAARRQVEISAGNEERVRALLQELAASEPSHVGASSAQPARPGGQQQLAQYSQLYEKLLQYRFKPEHVQQVLRALPVGSHVTLDACLDWLCLHLPQSELPKRFAGTARAGIGGAAGVKVVARRQQRHQQAQQPEAEPDASSSSGGSDDEVGEPRPGPPGEKEDDAAAAKAWILQQYGGDGLDDDDGSSQVSSSSSEIEEWELWGDPREIERRRAERSKQKLPPEQRKEQVMSEFARAKDWAASAKAAGDKPGQKEAGRLIAGLKAEMAQLGISEAEALAATKPRQANAEAAAKPQQSNAGGAQQHDAAAAAAAAAHAEPMDAAGASAIDEVDDGRHLAGTAPHDAAGAACQAAGAAGGADGTKHGSVAAEPGANGVNDYGDHGDDDDDWEAMLEQGLFEGPAVAGTSSGTHSEPAGRGASCGAGAVTSEEAAEEASAADWKDGHATQQEEQQQEQQRQQQAPGSKAEPGEEAWVPADLFDDDNGLPAAPVKAAAPPPPAPEVVVPWGMHSSTAQKKRGALQKGPSPAAARAAQQQQQLQLPKALLQKHCQQRGWAAPRFERLGVVGVAGAGAVPGKEHRYSVTVDPGATVARGKAAKKAAAASGGLTGPKTYQLLADEDGWPSIQDAQNAAATRALFELLPKQPLYHSLSSPWREAWLGWYQQKAEGGDVGAEAEQQQEREEFVRALLMEQQQKQQQQQQQQQLEADQSAEAADAKLSTSERATADEEAVEWELAAGLSEQEQQEQQQEQDAWQEGPEMARRSAELRQQLLNWRCSQQGAQWQAKRGQLPIAAVREEVCAALQRSDVLVVSGETGSGKTTQVPQFLLEEAALAGTGTSCSIIVTQPRRIAAISVAERVAAERGEVAPGAPGAAVGYHVRLDAAVTRDTRLLFCTTGILLRRLSSDPLLSSISHVIVDEVHERTLQGDFLMALLKRLMQQRNGGSSSGRGGRGGAGGLPPLKVVLMSATLDSAAFSAYFGNCPVVCCQGRTFPVEQLFLEDVYEATGYALDPDSRAAIRSGQARAQAASMRKQAAGGSSSRQALLSGGWGDEEKGSGPLNHNYDPEIYARYSPSVRRSLARLDEEILDLDAVEAVVAHIDEAGQDGAILVFLPGMGEISALLERLSSNRRYCRGSHWLLPLHSAISPAEQRRAFEVPPPGVRKIVIATNIAETSVTIEDVVFVVDSGRFRERRYNPSRHMSMLVEDWVSVASALQRKGRAGRVRPGRCYCLYTRARFEGVMRKQGQPEMVRVPLEELVLQIHLLHLGPAADFLSSVLEPPARRAIEAALKSLREVGALQEAEEQLTPLGRHLAALPVDPRLGKLLVLGACLGCLSPALTIAASMSYKSPFAAPLDKQDELQRAKLALAAAAASSAGSSSGGMGGIAAGQQSDHLLLVAAYELWRAAHKQGKSQAAKVCRQHFLSQQTVEALADMRAQFAGMLVDIHFLQDPSSGSSSSRGGRGGSGAWWDDLSAEWNAHAREAAMVKAVLCAALSPHVATVLPEQSEPGGRPAWEDESRTEVAIHPGSVNHMLLAHQLREPYLVYLEKAQTSRVFLRDTTVVTPMALLLFGGGLRVLHEEGAVLVDAWLKLRAAAQTAVLVKHVRAALDALLQAQVAAPHAAGSGGGSGGRGGAGGGISGAGAGHARRQQASAVVDTIRQLLLDAEAASTARIEGRA